MRRTLALLATLLLGLLGGAMLLIAVAIMSFWQAVSPTEFVSWFSAHGDRIGRLMIPLGAAATIAALAAAAAHWRHPAASRRWFVVAAACALGVAITYPLFFAATNAAFARGILADSEVTVLLGRWSRWHWARTILGLLAFWAALYGTTIQYRVAAR